MPFSDPLGSRDETYFADGIADALIHEFSRLSGLRVISRLSTFAYRDTTAHPKDIARDLGATHLLTGNVARAGGRVSVAAQLIDPVSGLTIGSDRCEGPLVDLFELQDQLVLNIVRALQVTLAPAESRLFGHHRTTSVEAHDAFLRGLSAFWKMAPPFVQESLAHFARASAADPEYAPAKAWLAHATLHTWIMTTSAPDALRDEALRLAEAAMDLDPDLPFAVATLGWVNLWFKRSEPAISLCRRAVAMDPGNSELLLRLSMALSFSGDGDEGLAYAQRALALAPTSSPIYEFATAAAHLMREDYDNAIVALKRGYEIEPFFLPNPLQLALVYAMMDRQDEVTPLREFMLKSVGGSVAHYLRHPWIESETEDLYAGLVLKAGFP